jgi:predicted GNAT superfamily acetyltransferase
MNVTLLDASSPHWGSEVERIGVELGAGRNPSLFPYHFLFVTLSKIGGSMAIFEQQGQRAGVGFLFPRRALTPGEMRRAFTLRFHSLLGERPAAIGELPRDELTEACAQALGGCHVVFYDPLAAHRYERSGEMIGAVEIGRPARDEAEGLRRLQQEVWGSPPEFLYPVDIHSRDFGAGASLVARVENTLAGFLFGFYRFGGSPLPGDWRSLYNETLRLESQAMAVAPAFRGLRISSLLKRIQAHQAWEEGIGIIHWTADPLQFPNAALNFGLLRAVAYEFAADLYPFRNDLNRVHASRLALTWLVGSQRVQDVPLVGARTEIVELGYRSRIPCANDGPHSIDLGLAAPIIAIEVPVDWTAVQQANLPEALAWRQITDAVLQHYVGAERGKYVITGVGIDRERRFLLAEKVSPALWERLGRPV